MTVAYACVCLLLVYAIADMFLPLSGLFSALYFGLLILCGGGYLLGSAIRAENAAEQECQSEQEDAGYHRCW